MGSPSSSQSHRAQEVQAIWTLFKQTFTVAKAWLKWSSGELSVRASRGVVQVDNVSVKENTDLPLPASTTTLTPNPFGNGPSTRHAAEGPPQRPVARESLLAAETMTPTSSPPPYSNYDVQPFTTIRFYFP
ncbi:hypothetical protein FRC04_005937 [Tulasnella sp. 424]|nr:hypothetical protein FRC04_005937 [Tulasnella sp. 424]KAG8976079.1 hypothetical protein FRC05_004711 [Tulasnella sp. 425]